MHLRGRIAALAVGTALYALLTNLAANALDLNTPLYKYAVLAAWFAFVIVIVLRAIARAHPARVESDDALDAAARDLAHAVEREWREEKTTRGLDNPEPINLVWHDVDAPAVPSAGAILGTSVRIRLRRSGDLKQITATFLKLKRRQLIVVGKRGSGKTVLALLLTLELLEHRKSAHANPVPVLLTASSWDPHDEHLDSWLARRLAEDYPFIGRTAAYGRDAPARLVQEKRVTPILDGLDELAPGLQPLAISRIVRAVGGDRPIVVTCRREPFFEALHPGAEILAGARVIEIEDVFLDDAWHYLVDSTAHGEERWGPVLEVIQADRSHRLAYVLRTPLMLWLARTIYADPEVEPAKPIQLLDPVKFPDSAAIETHLLDGLIGAVYDDVPPPPWKRRRWWQPQFSRRRAQRAFETLAARLQKPRRRGLRSPRRTATEYDFAWWDLYRAVPNFGAALTATAFAVPLVIGPALLLLWLSHSWTSARLFALVCGSIGGVAVAGLYRPPPPGRISPRTSLADFRTRSKEAAKTGFLAFSIVAVAFGGGLAVGGATDLVLREGAIAATLVGAGIATIALLNGPVDYVAAQNPRRVLREDRRVAVVASVVGGSTAAFVTGRLSGSWSALAAGLTAAAAAPIGMTSWGWFLIARLYFFAGRRLPFRLMSFLEDAHKRGVFRQAGSVYQFRHRTLQERLAHLDAAHVSLFRIGLGRPRRSGDGRQRAQGAPPAR